MEVLTKRKVCVVCESDRERCLSRVPGENAALLFAFAAAGTRRKCKVLTVDLLQTQTSLHN